jgi:hypothetical protein
MQNRGLFGGPAGVNFFHQTSKFWSRGLYIEALAGVATKIADL